MFKKNEQNTENENVTQNETNLFEKYEKTDCASGFTTNKAEIHKLRASRRYKIVTEKLLGSYDDNGKYVISPHIMAELLAMPKLLDKEDNGKLFLTAEYKDGTLFKFVVNEPRKQSVEDVEMISSTLEFCEEISFAGGYEIETIHHIVGSYKTSNILKFEEGRKSAFNIFNRDEYGQKARTPTNAIDAKLEYLKKIEQEKHKNFEKIEKNFYKQTIKALKKTAGGKAVLEKFKNKKNIVENFIGKKDKSKFRAYNDMLTLMLEEPEFDKLTKSVDYQKNIGKINKEYLDEMKKVDADIKQNKKIQEINEARSQISAIPVDDYFNSISSKSNDNFTFDTSNVQNKTENSEKILQSDNAGIENSKDFANNNSTINDTDVDTKNRKDKNRNIDAKPEIGESKSDSEGEKIDIKEEIKRLREEERKSGGNGNFEKDGNLKSNLNHTPTEKNNFATETSYEKNQGKPKPFVSNFENTTPRSGNAGTKSEYEHHNADNFNNKGNEQKTDKASKHESKEKATATVYSSELSDTNTHHKEETPKVEENRATELKGVNNNQGQTIEPLQPANFEPAQISELNGEPVIEINKKPEDGITETKTGTKNTENIFSNDESRAQPNSFYETNTKPASEALVLELENSVQNTTHNLNELNPPTPIKQA